MTLLPPHPVRWQAPAPLWARFGASAAAAVATPDQSRPAILRFDDDTFMDRLLALLAQDPAELGTLLARPETWRTPPAAGAADLVERTNLPRIVRAASRAHALLRARAPLAPVRATADVTEAGQARPALPLKLYHTAHQRHYLVSASLICGILGLPDRRVAAGGDPQVFFVLRRLLPPMRNGDPSVLREFAFVKDAAGGRWRRVAADADDAHLAPGEERLPLFALSYLDPISHPRVLWTGVLPVGRREEYMGAAIDRTPVPFAAGLIQSVAPLPMSAPQNAVTARKTDFMLRVAEPWKALIRAAAAAAKSMTEAPPSGLSGGETDDKRAYRAISQNMQWQMASWLILLEFADYIAAQLPKVWNALGGATVSLSTQEGALRDWLAAAAMPSALAGAIGDPAQNNPATGQTTAPLRPAWPDLATALRGITAARDGLEGAETLYSAETTADPHWPDHHFLLAGLAKNLATGHFECVGPFQSLGTEPAASADEATPDPVIGGGTPAQLDAANPDRLIDRLIGLVVRALERRPEDDQPLLPFAAQLAKSLSDANGDAGTFVVRFVFINPECGPLHEPTVSPPTQRFQLAHFFDPDAPARPIRITLPLDTTPAGLRKHRKNTAFVISDVLCGQIQRAKGMGLGDLVRSVLPWPFHKDLDTDAGKAAPCANDAGVNIGMICSLSIPIITICALLLLLMIVLVLDFIFRWVPFFAICVPGPGLRAKRSP